MKKVFKFYIYGILLILPIALLADYLWGPMKATLAILPFCLAWVIWNKVKKNI